MKITLKNFTVGARFVITAMCVTVIVGFIYFFNVDNTEEVIEEPEFASWIIEMEVYGYDVDSHKIIVKETYITDVLHIDEVRRTVRFKTERNEYITVGIDSVKIEGTRL